MRRTRLIWLAMGIVVGLVAAAIPSLFRTDEQMYLKLVERDRGQADGKLGSQQPVLEKVWACGGREFSTALPTHVIEVNIPIKPENEKVVGCVIKATGGTDISVTMTNSER
jgi:hypothetical protein